MKFGLERKPTSTFFFFVNIAPGPSNSAVKNNENSPPSSKNRRSSKEAYNSLVSKMPTTLSFKKNTHTHLFLPVYTID